MRSLSIENLKIIHSSFNKRELEIVICENLSLRFNQGEVIGILGPNGSGKTSLLRSLINLQKTASGSIKYCAKNEHNLNPKLAYIPQDIHNSFFSWLSLKQNILITGKQKKLYTKLKALWDDFDISFKTNLKPSECSGGMLQQAAIVRSFINSPNVIVGDEPFSALDVSTASKIRSSFRKKIKESKAIAILALHNLDDLLAICDKIIFIPNKPYTSDKNSSLNVIKIYTNKYIDKEEILNEEGSLAYTIEKLFN